MCSFLASVNSLNVCMHLHTIHQTFKNYLFIVLIFAKALKKEKYNCKIVHFTPHYPFLHTKIHIQIVITLTHKYQLFLIIYLYV